MFWLLDVDSFFHTHFPNASGIHACAICIASIIKATGATCHAHLAYRSSLRQGNSAFATWCQEILAVQVVTAPSAALRSFDTHTHTFYFFTWAEVVGSPVRHSMKARTPRSAHEGWQVWPFRLPWQPKHPVASEPDNHICFQVANHQDLLLPLYLIKGLVLSLAVEDLPCTFFPYNIDVLRNVYLCLLGDCIPSPSVKHSSFLAADLLGWLQYSEPVPPNFVAWIRGVFPFSWKDTNLQVHLRRKIASGTMHPHHQRTQQLSNYGNLFYCNYGRKSVDRMDIRLLQDCKSSIWQGSLRRS